MADTPSGHIERLPSGSYRVKVYAGADPITRKQVYFRETAKTLTQAQIALGKLLAQAQAGYADPVSEVDRRPAAYLAELTRGQRIAPGSIGSA